VPAVAPTVPDSAIAAENAAMSRCAELVFLVVIIGFMQVVS
jgi:hypothetical protein